MSTTTTSTQAAHCPSWCVLPAGHDPLDPERLHEGPEFGRYYFVACSRLDGTLSPGELAERYRSPEMNTAEDVMASASHLIEAAAWMKSLTSAVQPAATSDGSTFHTPCPDWCTSAGEPRHTEGSEYVDEPGIFLRNHTGPTFGRYIATYAEERSDGADLRYIVSLEGTDGSDVTDFSYTRPILDLAADIQRAAAWLAEHDPQPWWHTAGNPPCPHWCERSHPEGDFAFGGGMLCSRAFLDADSFKVEVTAYTGLNEDGDGYGQPEFSVYSWSSANDEDHRSCDELERYATALRDASYFVRDCRRKQEVEDRAEAPAKDLPWWMKAPNPPCSPWCTETHDPDEFKAAGSGQILCRRTITDTESLLVVLQQIHTEDGEGGLETLEPDLRILVPSLDADADIRIPAVGDIIETVLRDLPEATREAADLIAQVKA